MSYSKTGRYLLPGVVIFLTALPGHTTTPASSDEIVVTATKDGVAMLDLFGNTVKIPEDRINITDHQHIHQLGVQATGTWISRGSGQEHLTAIRSPVLTGPGACGAFLILENSIPTRPVGFCNVNQLFEIDTEQAQSIEILRGPANALYGSNGLHGTMNVLLPEPGSAASWDLSGEVGPDDFYRGQFAWDGTMGDNDVAAGIIADTYGGFRDDSGYEQQKGFFRLNRSLQSGEFEAGFSASNLDQETAGFIIGEDTYKDPVVRTTNPNPEAFRKADSQRLFLRWIPNATHALDGSDFRVFLRRSDMEFLQHFIPGQPLEENGQTSGGLMWVMQKEVGASGVLTTGMDLEYADGFVKQFQAEELNGDSAFLNETLPQGWQYNFDVSSFMIAPYGQLEFSIADSWQIQIGLRLDYLYYDYDNRMVTGNTHDDGVTMCGFGGCRYNRPADRSDDFLNLAPNAGIRYRINPSTSVFLNASRGFRAPQANELYRLQSTQDVADLDSETLDSLELGIHWQTSIFRVEATSFAMYKRHFIFQDADRFNISDGKTRHLGVELQADARTEAGIYAGIAGTYAEHTYDFDREARGEIISKGNDVDTAPRTLASMRIGYERNIGVAEIEAVHQGSYDLNAANTAEYSGHNLLNMRIIWQASDSWSVALRVNNVTDKLIADRADFAFGDYRYFPGREREFFLQVRYRALKAD
jgi:iron complex outermembrane receptor protein